MSDFIKFTLLSPPFSVNQAYYKNRQLTEKARTWRSNILLQLSEPLLKARLAFFRSKFDPLDHCLAINYSFLLPPNILFNSKGEISSRSMDLTNIEKLLQDSIFESRYNGRVIEGKIISNLDLNDKYITQLTSSKEPSWDSVYRITITISVTPLQRRK